MSVKAVNIFPRISGDLNWNMPHFSNTVFHNWAINIISFKIFYYFLLVLITRSILMFKARPQRTKWMFKVREGSHRQNLPHLSLAVITPKPKGSITVFQKYKKKKRKIPCCLLTVKPLRTLCQWQFYIVCQKEFATVKVTFSTWFHNPCGIWILSELFHK